MKNVISVIMVVLCSVSGVFGKLTLNEIRTASNNVVVVYIKSDTLNVNEVNTDDLTKWKINGQTPIAINKFVTKANACNFSIYLETSPLKEGTTYKVETPYGMIDFEFDERKIFCESIKTNQVGYSALSKVRYANFAIWLGTGGGQKINGTLPSYEVFKQSNGKVVAKGTLKEVGEDASSGDFVYRIDLADVPEGGPYKIAVKGYGCSYSFGVGGEFSKMLAYTIFRSQYLQRCGCPILIPNIREKPCHTLIYDADGPIGEANIVVKGDEPTFKCYGGYHDAGDADRRAYHMENPILNLMIYEAFPKMFTDGQYNIPGDFDKDFNIVNYTNKIPDILDEALWGTLAWEYLQNEDGSIHFGTETKGYPEPFDASLDNDTKKYGTVKVDNRATCVGAGLFMYMARMIKPFNPEKAKALFARAEKSKEAGDKAMVNPERLFYHIQRYLYTGDQADHLKIKELYKSADSLKYNWQAVPGYSMNDTKFDNPAYIMSYVLSKDVPTDPEIVALFKKAIQETADSSIVELKNHTYPVGNNPDQRAWGHNVRQPQFACAPLLQWQLSKEQKYFDAASELMDYQLGLNPIGICYVTGLGFYRVNNVHDRESAYTIKKGMGPKPGITVFGPGVLGFSRAPLSIPDIKKMPKQRQYVDDLANISFNEFTIFETMQYNALYTVLANGGKWNEKNPFDK